MGNELYIKKNIERVMVIDDQEDVRDSIAETVEDADYEPIVQSESFISLENCIEKIKNQANAVIIDKHLSQRNYANFDGIQVVKQVYSLFIPILLATTYLKPDSFEIQEYKQYLPVILNPSQIDPEAIRNGFKICQNEFSGNFLPERKPWRSLIRVEDMSNDENSIYVVVPSWSTSEKIRLPISLFPTELQNKKILGMRFFADVNIGAEDYKDLYFKDSNFEIAEKPVGRYAKFLHS